MYFAPFPIAISKININFAYTHQKLHQPIKESSTYPIGHITPWQRFVNADEIAKGISPFAPESVAIQAGKLMLQRIETLLAGNVSFAIETTLSTRSCQSLVRRAKSMGYTVQLLFFWLESPEIAVRRVERRVSEGGHNIPFDTVYRRYHAGLKNLFNIFMPIVDYWALYDNNLQARLIADSEEVQDNETFNKIKNNYV